MVSNKVPSNFLKDKKDWVSNLESHKARSKSSPSKKPVYSMCGKKNWDEYLVRTDNYLGCGKSFHQVRDFPNMSSQLNRSRQSQASGTSSKAPKGTTFMLSALDVRKRSLPIWSPICYKSYLLMFIPIRSQFYLGICNPI